jgi:hypothetical protein
MVLLIARSSSHRTHRRLTIGVVCVIAFIAAGEAEIYTAAQCVTLTLIVATAWTRSRPAWRPALPALCAAWLGSLAGLAVELASPGAALRSAAIGNVVAAPRPPLLALPYLAFVQLLSFVGSLIQRHWLELLAVALVAALVGARSNWHVPAATRSTLIACAVTIAGTFAVLLATMAPAAYYYGSVPPMWDQLIPVYACVCAAAALGWLAGRSLPGIAAERINHRSASIASVLAGVAIALGPVVAVITLAHDLPSLRAYAATKDAEAADAEIAASNGEPSATVPPLVMVDNIGVFSHPDYEDLTNHPEYWINRDEAAYYGLTFITTSPPPAK